MPKQILLLLLSLILMGNTKPYPPDSKRAADIRAKVWPSLQKQMKNMGLQDDQPIYVRVFKENNLLEIWIKSGREYKLFNKYIICYYSGGLGTKTKTGDNKCPEGYYAIKPAQLNPVSNYRLAVNIGYPNKLEQQLGYTGNSIMIHGYCASIGCYAMNDQQIEEIYTLIYEALLHGQQSIELNIYPFKMDTENMRLHADSPYFTFWKSLKGGYEIFEKTHVPAVVSVVNKRYAFK